MKKPIIIVTCIFIILNVLAFTSIQYDLKKNSAEVEQIEGKYIFIKSKPLLEYDVIGSEKTTFVLKGNPEELVNIALKKAKKSYPGADGIIFNNESMDRYDFIKFK